MASVELANTRIALWSDPGGTELAIPTLQVLTPTETFEQVFVRFEGDRRKTGFRGEGDDLTMQMTARYAQSQQAQAGALVELFRFAHREDSDGRLLLRTHAAADVGLSDMEAVMVPTFSRPFGMGRYVDVSFTAQAVQYSLEA